MRELLIIDPQVDFCSPDGSLYVEGADQDMVRLAAMVESERFECERITVTMDQHCKHHIAHGVYWANEAGEHPPPFTAITAADIKAKKWLPVNPANNEWVLFYCEELGRNGKYTLMIWPEHCLIGSTGAAVEPVLYAALQKWQERTGKDVVWFPKGENPNTEHYSAVEPEVEITDSQMGETWSNVELQELLEETDADDVLVAGEALSHCVAATVRDMEGDMSKIVLLTDATSPVPLAIEAAEAFVKEYQEIGGMRMAATVDYYLPIVKTGTE
jgi:nicotinamidase-related amidase